MKLGVLYRLEEFQPEWAQFMAHRVPLEFYVPTEMVVLRPELSRPMVARAYDTGLYAYKGNVVDYDWLVRLHRTLGEQFRGTSAFDSVMMAEVWGNYGDDGHTYYSMMGFRFVPDSVLQLKKDGWPRNIDLPEAMTEQWFDDERMVDIAERNHNSGGK